MKTMIIFTLMLSATAAMAQTSTTSTQSLRDQLRKSPAFLKFWQINEAALNINNEAEFYDTFTNYVDMQVGWKLDKNHVVSAFTEFETGYDTAKGDDSTHNQWAVTEIIFDRNNILKERTHGVELWATAKWGMIHDNDIQLALNRTGYVQGRVYASKKFTSDFSALSFVRYDRYIGSGEGESTLGARRRDRWRVYLYPQYALNDSLSLYSMFRYELGYNEKDIDGNIVVNSRDLTIQPTVSWSINKDLYLDTYIQASVTEDGDKRAFRSNIEEHLTFGTELGFTVF